MAAGKRGWGVLPGIVTLLLILLISYQLAILTWRLLDLGPVASDAPVSAAPGGPPQAAATPAPDAVATANRISALHLFGEAGAAPEVAPQPVQAQETRLNLKLYGVFGEDDPKTGAAIIGKERGEQRYYNVGDEIDRGVKLVEVYPDHVILDRNGRREMLRFPKESSRRLNTTAPSVQPAVALPSLKEFREQIKKHPEKLLEQVNFVPVRTGEGALKGYRLLPRGNRELYNRLGVRPSDLIVSVNGIPLNNDQQALKVINELNSAKRISLGILRRGEEQTLDLNLE